MTSPINSFQDILDAMERDPALRDALRRHILTDELLQVPVRLERVEADIKVLKEDVSVLKEDVCVLKEDVAVLKEDVAVLKEDVAVLKEDVAVLKEDVSELKVGQARLEVDFAKMGGDVSRLLGEDYESHVATYAHRFLRRGLGINAVLFACQRDKSALTRLLDEAEMQGRIDAAEVDELDRADLILTVDGPTDYLLSEVSITIQQDDIDRARERAGLFAKATAQTVAPFAFGTREEPGLRRGEVQVVLIPEHQVS